jgi:molybdopterin/thiamine biosynthesis adenylyltransferase
MIVSANRLERQVAWFGPPGQAKLRESNVAVVGFGGLGSHVVQQLAFLGVGHLSIVDPETVEVSNLNRLIGASPSDVGQRKVDVAARLVNTIDPSIEVLCVAEGLPQAEAYDAVKAAGIVFGCVDHDGPRLLLSELCAAYEQPYFDLATEIFLGPPAAYGGRVVYSHGGNGCLSCLNEISLTEAGRYFLDEAALVEESRLYGVPAIDLGESGPSVVSLNGTVASLAVTEFMVFVTGLRQPSRLLRYYGHISRVTVSVDPPSPDCFYCKSVYGLKERAGVERYRRERLNRRDSA